MNKVLSLTISLLSASILMAEISDEQRVENENLATEKCGACHLMGKITKEKLNRMAAPPYWAIAKNVKLKYPNKIDGINFMMDFTINPAENKMLFPKETKERFGLMPSQKDNVTKDELKNIINYILGE